MTDPNRESVVIGQSLVEQDLRVAIKHALIDTDETMKDACEDAGVSYNALTKAMSGEQSIANASQRDLVQRLLHSWRPGSYVPAPGQEDRLRQAIGREQ